MSNDKKRIKSLLKFFKDIIPAENHLYEYQGCINWTKTWFKGSAEEKCPCINCAVCVSKQALYMDKLIKKGVKS